MNRSPLPAAPLFAALALFGLAAGGAAAAAGSYRSSDGLVRLNYPVGLAPGHDFSGKSLMAAGWRLRFDGKPAGPGTGVVSFAQAAHGKGGHGQAIELLQVGMSHNADVVAHCGTEGLAGQDGQRLPNRMIGGHRWTAWHNSDAGMSQTVDSIDLRTVVDGVCYAADRVSYGIGAGSTPPRGSPTQAVAAQRMDAILATLVVGGRR